MTDALGNSTAYTYTFGGCSACGSGGGELSASVTDADGNTVFYEYDALGRRIKETDPLGNSVSYTYDAAGNIMTKTDADGHVAAYAYDPLSRLTEMTDPAQGKTRYAYDLHSLLTGLTDPAGIRRFTDTMPRGQPLRTVSPDAGETLYEYYADGNLKSETDARGITAAYYYDNAGRPARTAFPDSAEDIFYTYDSPDSENGKARLTNIRDASGTTVFHYDIPGRTVREIRTVNDAAYTVSYEYDNVGSLKSVTYHDNRKITYAYNALNRPVRVTMTAPDGESVILAENFVYDRAGNLLSFRAGNGLTQTRAYDAADRIAAITVPGVAEYVYAYDPAGNITGITDRLNPALSRHYAYDPADRLASASGSWGNLAWTYDANGKRQPAHAVPRNSN